MNFKEGEKVIDKVNFEEGEKVIDKVNFEEGLKTLDSENSIDFVSMNVYFKMAKICSLRIHT